MDEDKSDQIESERTFKQVHDITYFHQVLLENIFIGRRLYTVKDQGLLISHQDEHSDEAKK